MGITLNFEAPDGGQVTAQPPTPRSLLNIPVVSHSQMQTFDRCSFAYKLGYIDNWTAKETKPYFITGNLVHKYLFILYKNIMLTSYDHCFSLIQTEVDKDLRTAMNASDQDQIKRVSRAANIVKMYIYKFAALEDRDWIILDSEKYFKVSMKTPKGKSYTLNVGIDVVARQKSTGRLWIWDTKSFSGKSGFWSDTKIMMDPQFPTYLVALHKIGAMVVGAMLNEINTYDYKDVSKEPIDKLFKRTPIYHSSQELEGHEQEFGRMVDRMLETVESGDFVRSRRSECEYCQFNEPCILNLKGTPLGDIMPANFRQKVARPA